MARLPREFGSGPVRDPQTRRPALKLLVITIHVVASSVEERRPLSSNIIARTTTTGSSIRFALLCRFTLLPHTPVSLNAPRLPTIICSWRGSSFQQPLSAFVCNPCVDQFECKYAGFAGCCLV